MFIVVLETADRAKIFNEILLSHSGDVDVKQGRYVVDGKSIMGLYALNLMSPVEVTTTIDEDDLYKKCKDKNIV